MLVCRVFGAWNAPYTLAEINGKLGDPATYTECSGDFIAGLNARREVLESKVAELEESWLELEMSLEEAV